MRRLTTVSYVLLGYLALRPTTAYELTKQMTGSGAALVWPRTRSRIYEEPKNLVEHGLATGDSDVQRGRKRTVYSITPAGRDALHDWLATPGTGPSTEDEVLLKVFYANFGDREALLVQLDAVRSDLLLKYEGAAASLDQLRRGEHIYPEREHLTNLLIRHFVESLDARLRWLENTEEIVADWPDTTLDERRRATARDDSTELLAHVEQQLVRARNGAPPA
jgi:DNA-binding PadR family transcriptional regulator